MTDNTAKEMLDMNGGWWNEDRTNSHRLSIVLWTILSAKRKIDEEMDYDSIIGSIGSYDTERKLRTVYLQQLEKDSFLYNWDHDHNALSKVLAQNALEYYVSDYVSDNTWGKNSRFHNVTTYNLYDKIMYMGMKYYGDHTHLNAMMEEPECATPIPESDPIPKPEPAPKITISIKPRELVARQTITKDNCVQWIDYVIANCTDSASYMKVLNNCILLPGVSSKYLKGAESKLMDRIIELDLSEVYIGLMIYCDPEYRDMDKVKECLEKGSYKIARYLVTSATIHTHIFQKWMNEMYEAGEYEVIKKLLTNVSVALSEDDQKRLAKHPENYFIDVLMLQYPWNKDLILKVLTEEKRYNDLKTYALKYL